MGLGAVILMHDFIRQEMNLWCDTLESLIEFLKYHLYVEFVSKSLIHSVEALVTACASNNQLVTQQEANHTCSTAHRLIQ